MPSPGRTFRSALTKGLIVAPGAYDALSARIAAQSGAQAVYMTGFGVAGSLLGVPDVGLVSATEMAERVRALVAACGPVPLIADGDNGHGGPLNVERMVQFYESAGAAAIQIEDQVLPKRCGHMEGKEVIPLPEAVAKIRAAVAARGSRDFSIIARTDARAVHGMDEALRRGEAFVKAGADLLFVEAPQSEAELRQVAKTFAGVKLVANMVEDGKTPYLSGAALEKLGFALAIFPVSALLAVSERLQGVYRDIVRGGRLSAKAPRITFGAYNEMMGLSEMRGRADGYLANRSKKRRK